MIVFPIIRRFEIKGYQLFQTEKSDGITHALYRGVHAVVGINGLGKTTLLTLLYRLLLGPFDQSKSDEAGLLGSQHELSAWRNKGYFRDRVNDSAADATAEAEIEFGTRTLTIKRKIGNLQIEELNLDGESLEASHEAYMEIATSLSGAATFFDFFAILRYLVFFLEDRVELIWDRRSQFDMLRILLFDKASAKAASEAYDVAQVTDSHYRNRRAITGRDRANLAQLEAQAGHAQASQVRALRTVVEQAEERDSEQATLIEESRQRVEDARLRREKTLLDLQEARNALEFEEQAHYKQLFPNLGETAQYVFLNILGGGGCLVCGSTGDNVANHLRTKLEAHRCPICDSPATQHEKVTTPADFSRARLRKLQSKVDQLRKDVQSNNEEIDRVEQEHRQLVERREEDRQEWMSLRGELAKFGPIEMPNDADLDRLRAAVEEGERELKRLLAERTAAEARYGRIIRKQKALIDNAAKTVQRRFRDYAGLVLTERCDLSIAKELRSIGQEGERFEFPFFEVLMTSGVFDQSMSTRDSKEAVSQSQREFLDVAFRLALIEAATNGKSDSMLVLETPESSLDSLFVAKVGEALRHYSEKRVRNNVLVASTNLNSEDMLGALLGTVKPPSKEREPSTAVRLRPRKVQRLKASVVPAKERLSRLVNLLELAAPNAALREHRAYYTKLLKQSLGTRRST